MFNLVNTNNAFKYKYDTYKIECLKCTYSELFNKCGDNYHICTASELLSGAFQMARANGILRLHSDIWLESLTNDIFFDNNTKKIGICCKNVNIN